MIDLKKIGIDFIGIELVVSNLKYRVEVSLMIEVASI